MKTKPKTKPKIEPKTKPISAAKQLRSAKNIALLEALWESVESCAPTARAHGFGELWDFMCRERTSDACDTVGKQLYHQNRYNKFAREATDIACMLRDLVLWHTYNTSMFYGVHRTAFRRIQKWVAQQTAPQNMR